MIRRLRPTPFRLAVAILLGSLAYAGVGYAASLGIATNKLHAWNQTLTKASCNQTYTTEDDTYVQQGNPSSTSGGSAATLSITNGTTAQNWAFVRFDLSGCSLPTTGGADSATLTVVVTTAAAGHTISVFPVYSSWSSASLTWTGASSLTIGSTATATFTSSNGSKAIPVTADVDAQIKAGAFWGWVLKDTTGGGAGTTKIASASNGTVANRPTLTLADEK